MELSSRCGGGSVILAGNSSLFKRAYFGGRQTHFRACNSLVATRSAQGLCITSLRQESRPSRTLGALSASCSENTRPAILYRVGTLPAQVHAGGVRPLSDAWSV